MAKRKGVVNQSALKKLHPEDNNTDTRFYKPTPNSDTGSVGVVIRFLPSPCGNLIVNKATHNFKGSGGNYYSRCRSTLPEKDCPICKIFFEYHNNNDSYGKKFSRKMKYISNILVINDPEVTSNNGKVFLFEYGQAIHAKIQGKIYPKNKIEKSCLVFAYDEEDGGPGANFNLIGNPDKFTNASGKVVNYLNYESSYFDSPSSLPEEIIDEVDPKLFDISQFDSEKCFMTPDEMLEKYNEVEGITANNTNVSTSTSGGSNSTKNSNPFQTQSEPKVEKSGLVEEIENEVNNEINQEESNTANDDAFAMMIKNKLSENK